ncbi:hypothetical protein [Lederbergia citri]|uniref:Polysaccharide chain length determinant N-terminal domain-containing protein n=1 Tax=Lederbergia citri TaxID=2833580 RepID=A0A942TFD2_9BACI|nr:hypothetical protein [Lederbergia citri]MBS4195736.1 hypothetical protein [Lederbergia citri]
MENEKRFVFYEYLLFFWQKKWVLLLLPIILAAAAALVSLMNVKGYEGKVNFYTSSLNINDELTDNELIENMYKDKIDDNVMFSAKVLRKSRVQFKVIGTNKDSVEKQLEFLRIDFSERLVNAFNLRKNLTEKKLNNFTKQLTSNENEKEKINAIKWDQLTESEKVDVAQAMTKRADIIAEFTRDINANEKDLALAEEPIVYGESIEKNKGNVVGNTIVGFISGLFLSILILMLWKYITFAREQGYND